MRNYYTFRLDRVKLLKPIKPNTETVEGTICIIAKDLHDATIKMKQTAKIHNEDSPDWYLLFTKQGSNQCFDSVSHTRFDRMIHNHIRCYE